MDDDLEGEFVTVHLLQLMLAGEQQDEFEDEFFKLSVESSSAKVPSSARFEI